MPEMIYPALRSATNFTQRAVVSALVELTGRAVHKSEVAGGGCALRYVAAGEAGAIWEIQTKVPRHKTLKLPTYKSKLPMCM